MLLFIFLVIGVLAQQTFAEKPEAIVGGQPAEPVEFPFQVSLKHNGYHICSGSIINQTKILTAAHCVNSIAQPYTNLKIVTGTNDINKGQLHEVKSICVYPGYSAKYAWVNNVAVITLSEPIQYDQYRAAIALADFEPVVGQQCTLAGWGSIGTNGQPSRFLQKMNQVVVSLKKCQEHFITRLTEEHMCAYNSYGIGACKFDGGGPLVSHGKQIGILSWGSDPCATGKPDVYTDVYRYRNFILLSLEDV